MFYRKSFQDQNVSVHKRVKKCLSASVSWKESLQSIHSLYKLTRITFFFLLGKPLIYRIPWKDLSLSGSHSFNFPEEIITCSLFPPNEVLKSLFIEVNLNICHSRFPSKTKDLTYTSIQIQLVPSSYFLNWIKFSVALFRLKLN